MNDIVNQSKVIEVVKRGQKGADGTPGLMGVTKTASNLTLTPTHKSNAIRCSAAVTLALSPAATLGNGWHVMVDADGGIVTIDPDGAETVNGAATLEIQAGYGAFIYTDGVEIFARLFGASGSTVNYLLGSG